MSTDFRDMAEDTFAIVGGNSTKFSEMNKGIFPVFFVDTQEDEAATLAAGALRTRDMECVLIRASGDLSSASTHPVTDEIKKRFPTEYAAWKQNRVEEMVSGTPLKAWPLMPKGIMMEMNAAHIRSVEELAEVSDANMARFSDGRLWREKAKAWLEAAKGAGEAAKYAVENERLHEMVGNLQKQISALRTQIGEPENPLDSARMDELRRGPGRPRKDAA